MIRQNIQQKAMKNFVIATLTFIVSIVIGLIIFFVCIQRKIESNSRQIITSNVERQSSHFVNTLNIHFEYLETIAEFMGKNSELLCSENTDMLFSVCSKTALDRAMIMELDGTCYYDNGEVKNISFRRYYHEVMQGQRSLSDPLESIVDGETRVVLAVPIFHGDTQIGALAASYNISTLNTMLVKDIYNGKGSCMIITTAGSIVSIDKNPDYCFIDQEDNFFEYYGQKEILGSVTIKNIQENFLDQESGLVKLQDPGQPESCRYMSYLPLGINNWMVCYIVPVDVAQANYTFIKNYEFIYIGIFAVLVLLLLFAIIYTNNKRQTALLLYANTDPLTTAYNKRSTEEFIDKWLKNNHSKNLQVFLMMDIDYFKQINDTYGHAVGDEVLQKIGHLLKSHFRSHDIVGRIEGDEFIVLMTNVHDRNAAISRISELHDQMHRLEISALQGKHLTCSMGICFSPENGTTYRELYLHADHALYETKRKGRNGFTVYSK